MSFRPLSPAADRGPQRETFPQIVAAEVVASLRFPVAGALRSLTKLGGIGFVGARYTGNFCNRLYSTYSGVTSQRTAKGEDRLAMSAKL